jgi:hypothetical protein
MDSISMLQDVKNRLAKAKGKWPSIARGAGVDYFTVVRIGSGKAKSPRYETIEKLSNFLSKQ